MPSLKSLKVRIVSVKSTQKIAKAAIPYAVLAATCLFPNAAFAQPSASAQVENPVVGTYEMMLGSVAIMTHKYPRLEDVRVAVAGDCEKRLGASGSALKNSQFCYCAGVVTTALWMTYPSGNVRTVLGGLMDQGNGAPADVIKYQSPEMYSSICTAVMADLAAKAAQRPKK